MLSHARKGLHIPFIQGVAEKLPLRDSSFDFLSMGYALRHVSDLGIMFGEYFRVLKPGGILLLLDFARPRSAMGLRLGRFYLKWVVPWIGGSASRSQDVRVLFQYCWGTVENLVAPAAVLGAMSDRGFQQIWHRTRLGVLSEYVARRP
jgi:demethylmenaquinone methyltransferase/2-methoxy-6-polyprenyl-1,4-benzoquinol methylase